MFRFRPNAFFKFCECDGTADNVERVLYTARIHNSYEFDDYRIEREAILSTIRRDGRDCIGPVCAKRLYSIS